MFVFEISSGLYKGQSIPLTQGAVILVGRSPSCNVCFEDVKVSAAHAELCWNQEGFSVFDLGSANGTIVNGQTIKGRAALRIGDHVQIGDVIWQLTNLEVGVESESLIQPSGLLAFESKKTEMVQRVMIPVSRTEAQAAPLLRAPTRILGIGSKTQMAPAFISGGLVDDTLSAVASLKERVESGGQGAKILVQRDGRVDPFWTLPVSIGREQTSGVVFDDPAVSLRHAVIDFRSGDYILRDVGSSNGVYLGKRRIVEHVLKDGDVLTIGRYTLVVALGRECLGLSIQAPLADPKVRTESTRIGLIAQPLGGDEPKKKKKKASELVWYATSDLDRGVFRGRSALMALFLGTTLTFWMLARGDSVTLAGNRLAGYHEGSKFVAEAEAHGQDRCTACHIGAGKVSTVKCLDCHPNNRPSEGHAAADLLCTGCHAEHLGSTYKGSLAATLGCGGCHADPHAGLRRTAPKLVAGFSVDAPATVDFHLAHEAQGVTCLGCHAATYLEAKNGIRSACSQCHAPENPTAEDCQLCHGGHPDRPRPTDPVTAAQLPPPAEPPRFALQGLIFSAALLVLAFILAAVIPRQRKVAIEMPEAPP